MTYGQKAMEAMIEVLVEGKTGQTGLEWGFIVDTINKRCTGKHKVKNWMSIRGVVQYYINNGTIRRTNNIRTEVYVKA
jgi:hypothetical protein